MAHQPLAAREVEQFYFEANESARGTKGLNGHAIAGWSHIRYGGLAVGERFHHITHGILGYFQENFLHRLEPFAGAGLMLQYLGPAHQDLVTFSTHLFDEYSDLHAAAAGDVEHCTHVGLGDLHGDIRAAFTFEPIPNLARSDLLAILPGERAVVDGKRHLDGGRIDGFERQRGALGIVHQRFADEYIG